MKSSFNGAGEIRNNNQNTDVAMTKKSYFHHA